MTRIGYENNKQYVENSNNIINKKLKNIKHVVLDMDGTIYYGNKLIETTLPFFEILSSLGISYSFLTNNSSKSVQDYIQKLSLMGFEIERDRLYTSTLFAADYLKLNFPRVKNVFVLGTESMKLELVKYGFEIVKSSPDAVIIGYDTELTYEKLCKAAYWISNVDIVISTHPDRVCPTSESEVIAIDCGWMTDFLEQITKKKIIVLGKPHKEMLLYILKRYGLTPVEVAMVGDRLNTDMKMAVDVGVLSVYINNEYSIRKINPDITVQNLLQFGKILLKENHQFKKNPV